MTGSAALGCVPVVVLGALLACAAGAVVSAPKDPPGPPTLVEAVRTGDLEQVRRMLRDAGADVGAAVNWARRAKHFRMVELLTSRNAVD